MIYKPIIRNYNFMISGKSTSICTTAPDTFWDCGMDFRVQTASQTSQGAFGALEYNHIESYGTSYSIFFPAWLATIAISRSHDLRRSHDLTDQGNQGALQVGSGSRKRMFLMLATEIFLGQQKAYFSWRWCNKLKHVLTSVGSHWYLTRRRVISP